MRKLITYIDLLACLMGAAATAVVVMICDALGIGGVLSFAISLAACIYASDATSDLMHSEKLRNNPRRQIQVSIGIVAFFLLLWVVLGQLFEHDLGGDLKDEAMFDIGLPVLTLILNTAVRYYKKKKILAKFHDGSEGIQIENAETDAQRNTVLNDAKLDEKLTVTTKTGRFTGKKQGKIHVFLGIPYAKAPAGDLRWKVPQPLDASDTLWEAKHFGLAPIQTEETKVVSGHAQGEDCLNLNIWRNPADSRKKKPVLVLLAGGFFGYGSVDAPMYDGAAIVTAHPELVYVSVNSRRGAMGYVDFSEIPGGEAFPDSRNLGLLDQIAALEWLHSNVSSFGGDPESITLVGDNAGAISALLLALCPRAQTLFHKAILISPALSVLNGSIEASRKLGQAMAEKLNAHTMRELMAIPEAKLKEACAAMGNLVCGPVPDGKLIPADIYKAIAAGGTGKIQFITGLPQEETASWVMVGGSELAEEWARDYIAKAGLDGDTICREEGVTLREIVEELYYHMPLRRINDAMISAGKSAHTFLWDIASPVKQFGSNTVSCMAALLGNEKAAEHLGYLTNDAAQEIIQTMAVKFVKDQPMELYEDELHGLPALKWQPCDKKYGTYLYVGEKDAFCMPFRRPLQGMFDEL